WRLPLYLELGEMSGVEADIDALRRSGAHLRQRTYSISVRNLHLMLTLMRGEFADAERLIRECQALLPPTAQADQLAMQIFTLRREQGRLAGLQPVVSVFLRQKAAASVWRPGLALLHLELGQRDEARAEFETLAADDFTWIPRDGRW